MNYKYKFKKYYHKYYQLSNQIAGENDNFMENTRPKNMNDASLIFTMHLFDSLDGASNLISPINVSFALGLLQLVARGVTSNELTRLLSHKYNLDELKYIHSHFNNSVVKMTNVLIVDDKININQEYLDIVSKGIEGSCSMCPQPMIMPLASIVQRDFNDAKLITNIVNRNIEQNTDGMIKDIVRPEHINPNTSCTLINTFYFKGSWVNKFDVNNTTKMKFHRTETDMMDMMHQINHFNYYEDSLVQLIELPYDEKSYVMGIILPKKYLEEVGINYSVNNVPQFTPNEINEMINNVQYTKIDLYIPKFTQRKNTNLTPILKKLGVKTLFDTNAELDLMAPDIFVSNIVHESVIIVDEVGTKVATTMASAKPMIKLSKKEELKIFKADHAFVYYVRHINSNLFLFYGDIS